MTAMLDQLEHAGMIERRRSDQDRRQVIVSLTDAGHETLAAKRAKIEARTAEVLGPYSEAELDAAVRVMRSLVEILIHSAARSRKGQRPATRCRRGRRRPSRLSATTPRVATRTSTGVALRPSPRSDSRAEAAGDPLHGSPYKRKVATSCSSSAALPASSCADAAISCVEALVCCVEAETCSLEALADSATVATPTTSSAIWSRPATGPRRRPRCPRRGP